MTVRFIGSSGSSSSSSGSGSVVVVVVVVLTRYGRRHQQRGKTDGPTWSWPGTFA